MNQFTCNSCRGTFSKADPEHGKDGLCTQCQIAFGIVKLHDDDTRNKIEQVRTLEVVRQYRETLDRVMDFIAGPNYLERSKALHELCPWCKSPGFLMSQRIPGLHHRDDHSVHYRIACAATDCAAAPTLNWSATEADAWSVWDTRK